jgi:small basic protein
MEINYLAVVVCAVLSLVVGGIRAGFGFSFFGGAGN